MDEEPVGWIMYGQYLEVRDSRIGKGTFSTVKIPANSMIIDVPGPLVLAKDLPADSSIYLQIGPNSFLGPSGGMLPEYINHSCDPNCRMHVVGNRAFLYSLYVIPAGAELTFDYATTSTDTLDTWQMKCDCGSNKCRKVISGYQYLDNPLFDNYKSRDMIPLYILLPNMILKR
jgi:hypothetical protein